MKMEQQNEMPITKRLNMFFASENSSYLQNIFLRHRWGILCV